MKTLLSLISLSVVLISTSIMSTSLIVTSLVVTSTTATAAGSDGVWLRPKTKAHIRSFTCSGGLGLKIVKSAKKANIGKVIMCGAKKTGPNKWKGNLTSTEDGQVYTGYVKMSSGSLSLDGCVLGGLICKNESWKRLK